MTNQTELVSRATGASGVKGNSGSQRPSISPDGRYVAFQTVAANLDPDDADGLFDIYVRDTLANTTTLVSRATGAAASRATPPRLSRDLR